MPNLSLPQLRLLFPAMLSRTCLCVLCFLCGLVFGFAPNYRLHVFYYTWYGNPQVNGRWLHWNHTLLQPNGANAGPTPYHPPHQVASAYYPQLGPYSSLDPSVIQTHLQQILSMDAGVVAVSWWGRRGGDGQLALDSPGYTDAVARLLIDAAADTAARVAIHIEPYEGRSAASVVQDVQYFVGLNSRGLFHMTPGGEAGIQGDGASKPVFFVYDSYHTTAEEWAQYLAPGGTRSIRGTAHDAVVLSLLVDEHQLESLVLKGHFDGFYTYFGTDGFSYGSTTAHWRRLQSFAQSHGLLFCPSVGPGYDDRRLRPWNGANRRRRRGGAYYAAMWAAAVAAGPACLGLTSWNEWGEGTQLEPAVPVRVGGTQRYSTYLPHPPDHYLDMTRQWSRRYRATMLAREEL